jgi:galactokinase
VADSGVARSLATSSYGSRVRESRAALARANDLLGARFTELAEVPSDQFWTLSEGDFEHPLYLRARHVVTETARVRLGVDAMKAADWTAFGALMNDSGRSSAGDYEISHPEVEAIVEIARSVDGVLGARMMGGGEGGTALILTRSEAVNRLTEELSARFYESRSIDPVAAVRVFQFAPGASVESL